MDDHFSFAPGDPVRAQLGLGVAALRYQQLGFAVLPLSRLRKPPHRMLPVAREGWGGVHHASADPAWVWYWWQQDRSAGVGVACGSRSSLVVLDLDVKGDADGRVQLASWMSRRGLALPPGPWVSTPSGGVHLWLRSPAGLQVGQRLNILPGVDIKGDGGYVAAPPTMINVRVENEQVPLEYVWHGCPCQLPVAPAWLFEWIASVPDIGGLGSGTALNGDLADLEELKMTGLPVGERNSQLYRQACSLYGRYGTDAAGQAATWRQIEQVLVHTDMAGFTHHEIGVVLASARRFIDRQRAAERERAGGTFEQWQRAVRGW